MVSATTGDKTSRRFYVAVALSPAVAYPDGEGLGGGFKPSPIALHQD